jgi:chemotaxis protein methyltransferase CheR
MWLQSSFGTRKRDHPDSEHGSALAQAIVDTVREPLLVLDQDLRVVAASRSFYLTFRANSEDTLGRQLYALGDGQWDIPRLRVLLEDIIPKHAVMAAYEVEHEFPGIGQRTMLLNARNVFTEGNPRTNVLLAIEDITERRAVERKMKHMLRQKELLLDEMQHRIANSLQIIASILLLKAHTVQSEETRVHLQDAHTRVMSVAAVQQHLDGSDRGDAVEVKPYLSKLCKTLAAAMIGEKQPLALDVVVEGDADGELMASSQAMSIGLIVTEAVINALKHAFLPSVRGGRIVVAYRRHGADWTLSISDNGIGRADLATLKGGLGTSIIAALAGQLDARVDVASGPDGTTVALTPLVS